LFPADGPPNDHAKLLAYKVIEEAIQVGSYGPGGPVDIWEVGPEGVQHASDGEIEALNDAASLLREREVAMLCEEEGPRREEGPIKDDEAAEALPAPPKPR
jgi:hypothetical protein